MVNLFKVLKDNHTLIDLNLSNPDSMIQNSHLTAEVIQDGIYPYLTNKECVLNFLNLSGLYMGNEAFNILQKAIIKNASLISINLSYNHLSGV